MNFIPGLPSSSSSMPRTTLARLRTSGSSAAQRNKQSCRELLRGLNKITHIKRIESCGHLTHGKCHQQLRSPTLFPCKPHPSTDTHTGHLGRNCSLVAVEPKPSSGQPKAEIQLRPQKALPATPGPKTSSCRPQLSTPQHDHHPGFRVYFKKEDRAPGSVG